MEKLNVYGMKWLTDWSPCSFTIEPLLVHTSHNTRLCLHGVGIILHMLLSFHLLDSLTESYTFCTGTWGSLSELLQAHSTWHGIRGTLLRAQNQETLTQVLRSSVLGLCSSRHFCCSTLTWVTARQWLWGSHWS